MTKSTASYDVHPGVAMVQKWIAELPAKTGRSLDDWIALVKKDGVNGLTRATWLAAAKDIHSFDADGMLAKSDIPAKKATPCTSLFQVKGGKFVRVFPSKPASFDCNAKNVVTVKQTGS